MNSLIQAKIQKDEAEDRAYVRSREAVLQKVREEFANADQIFELLRSDRAFAATYFDYRLTPEKWPVIPVRRSDVLYIKKHTLSQRPYVHGHEFYELIYVAKGQCRHCVYPERRQITVSAGQILLIAPGVYHALNRAGEQDVIFKIVIPKPYVDAFVKAFGIAEPEGCIVFRDPGDQAEYFLVKMTEEGERREIGWENAMNHWLMLLLTELYRGKRRSYGRLRERLESYLASALPYASLSDFARREGYSADRAGKLLKTETGRTFSEWVNARRLSAAKQRLAESDLPIERIASELGYRNASGLYKRFSAAFGITPNAYRKMLR